MCSSCQNCPVRESSVFKVMETEELKSVSSNKSVIHLKKGDALFSEGDQLNGVYCIQQGVLKLSRLCSNGKDQIIKFSTKGEIVGQRFIISKGSTNISAIAVSDTSVCFIPAHNLLRVVEANPAFALEIIREITEDLKSSDEFITNLSQKTVKQRIAIALLEVKRKFGEDDQGFLWLTLSRQDISNVAGTAIESAIRVISSLKKEGILRTSGKRVAIQNMPKLECLIRGF